MRRTLRAPPRRRSRSRRRARSGRRPISRVTRRPSATGASQRGHDGRHRDGVTIVAGLGGERAPARRRGSTSARTPRRASSTGIVPSCTSRRPSTTWAGRMAPWPSWSASRSERSRAALASAVNGSSPGRSWPPGATMRVTLPRRASVVRPSAGQGRREAVVDLGGGDQEVLGADVVVLEEPGLLLRRQDHLAGLVGEPLEHHAATGTGPAHSRADLMPRIRHGDHRAAASVQFELLARSG